MNVINFDAERVENGWIVKIREKIAYNAVRDHGFVFKSYCEMINFIKQLEPKETESGGEK